MDEWGSAKGFSTDTDSGEEDEDHPEDDTVEDRPPLLYSVMHTCVHAHMHAHTHTCMHTGTHAHLATAVKQLQSEGMFNSL